jgi:hypothetical protein
MDYLRSFRLLAIIFLISPLHILAQGKTPNPYASDIYIPLRDRDEIKIIPLPDTLSADKEYLFRIQFSSKYRFSELFFDKGLATRIDSFLSIRPKTSMTEGADTATLRIIGFANNSRILLQHKFVLLAQSRSFPFVNPNKSTNITVNHIVLERNMSYNKRDFPEKCVFGYLENGHYNKDNVITGITVSVVNKNKSKNMYVKDDKPNDDMIREIHKAKKGSRIYIRLDVKNGKKNKSIWTSFMIND